MCFLSFFYFRCNLLVCLWFTFALLGLIGFKRSATVQVNHCWKFNQVLK